MEYDTNVRKMMNGSCDDMGAGMDGTTTTSKVGMVEGDESHNNTENDDNGTVEDPRKEARRLLFERIRRNKTQGIITGFSFTKSIVGGKDLVMPGGGKVMMENGKKETQTTKKTTGPRKKLSKTKGIKTKGVGTTKAKKVGAKSSSKKMQGQFETVSSQPGIMEYFGGEQASWKLEFPRELKTLLQKPDAKEDNSSVSFRPFEKPEFMTRETLEIKISETG